MLTPNFKPGQISEDGVATVGRDGWLFLTGGRNSPITELGIPCPADDSLIKPWQDLIRHANEEAQRLGVELAMLFIPDKMAVYPEYLPDPSVFTTAQARRVDRITAVSPSEHIYPLRQLIRAKLNGNVVMKTDTHLASLGAQTVFKDVMESFGLNLPESHFQRTLKTYEVSGDLGNHFDPPISEIATVPNDFNENVVLVEDDQERFQNVNRHLGSTQITLNEAATYQKRILVLGGSHSAVTRSQSSLGYLLAEVFREVHFVWAPFYWDSNFIRKLQPDFVLLQTNERFLTSAPPLESDIEALCAL